MSDTTASLSRKIGSAGDLQSVVRTMKAVAASSIGQYEQSVLALSDYYHCVELGLGACFREKALGNERMEKSVTDNSIGAVVFGSDQGLVGQFNDLVVDYAIKKILTISDKEHKPKVWAVGERVYNRLADEPVSLMGLLPVPSSIKGITPLVINILLECESLLIQNKLSELFLFYNRPTLGTAYEPVSQRLLPLDEVWISKLTGLPWPTKILPEIIGDDVETVRALLREYLFVSLFRASSESLASENTSRLASMQRADKNIDELMIVLKQTFHRLRQSRIDEELFDVVSGFEALKNKG